MGELSGFLFFWLYHHGGIDFIDLSIKSSLLPFLLRRVPISFSILIAYTKELAIYKKPLD